MRRSTRYSTAALLALASAAALADTPSNRVDPCAAITAADLQKAFGTAFQQRSADDGFFRHCSYSDAEGRFYVYVDSSEGSEQQLHNPLFAKVWEPGPTDLGVPAHINRNTHELRVFKKDVVVTIRLGDHRKGMSDQDQVARETALARIALPRM